MMSSNEGETEWADRAYDTNEIISYSKSTSITPVIPPKKNRLVLKEYDKDLYKLRHLVENAFMYF